MTQITDYHAKLFATELTRRCASDSVEKLTAVLSDAQVDLNPHQIDAALFAFANPLSRGAILADEVGLGKTIEAGLLLAQMWAERKRRLLVIAPANLRKQWAQELADKFFLPSAILEARTFNETIRAGNLNPFQQDVVVVCSYQFARKMEPYIRQTPWDLVVVDEAHRLRNVYKPTNKIANSIKQSIAPYRKVLLTATPLQNSLLELYGLVSIVDEHTFGDKKVFERRFSRLRYSAVSDAGEEAVQNSNRIFRPNTAKTLAGIVAKLIENEGDSKRFDLADIRQKLYEQEFTFRVPTEAELAAKIAQLNGLRKFSDKEDNPHFGKLGAFLTNHALDPRSVKANNEDFTELKERLKPVCKRTLRKQVLQYVKYTDRHALVQEFTPTDDEQRLYDLVSEYLQQPTLFALPASQRSLMTLILRKLLASSTYAISDTLHGLAMKLETAAAKATAVDAPPPDLPDNLEEYDELADEWDGDEAEEGTEQAPTYTPEQLAQMRAEMDKLREFHALARSITKNSKGEVLLTALRKGLTEAAKAQERQPKQKDAMSDPVVIAKAEAAHAWCQNASEATGTPWRYLLIPHDTIDESKTLAGLAAAYEYQPVKRSEKR